MAKNSRRIKAFFDAYVDKHQYNVFRQKNVINIAKNQTLAHNIRMCVICCHLRKMGVDFWTEVPTKFGTRPDIVCPTHIKPIIEVMCTETIDDFNEKKRPKYPYELQGEIIFNNTKDEFTVESIY